MTHKEVMDLVEQINIPSAYHHFAEGEVVNPPFLVYLYPSSNNFSADGKVYCKIHRLDFELYTEKKDIKLERQVEAVLDKHGLFYEKTEVWIEKEKLYEVLYEMEVTNG
nr:MAG TPA: tail completion protein [Caudoviricetes sp.]